MMAHEIRSGMDEVLASLPSSLVLASHADDRLVVGPTGAFVLATCRPGPLELAETAQRLEDLTSATREAFCQYLAWVPFVDAIVVTNGDVPRSMHITSAAIDLLRDTVTEGPRVIDPGILTTIRDVLRRGELNGWRTGLPSGDAKIDLCEPVQNSPSR